MKPASSEPMVKNYDPFYDTNSDWLVDDDGENIFSENKSILYYDDYGDEEEEEDEQ